MNTDDRFRINTPLNACQIIDGEAVLISFETGSYYSSDGAGAHILSLLEPSGSLVEIVDSLADSYDADRDTLQRETEAFLTKLLEAKILIAAEAGAASAPCSLDPPEQKLKFSAPELNAYDDLQDLFLLDPIHDVGQSGWPSRGADDNREAA